SPEKTVLASTHYIGPAVGRRSPQEDHVVQPMRHDRYNQGGASMNTSRVQARMRRGVAAAAVILTAAVGFAATASAQDYPNRPITAIVPFGAGGGADTQTRIWGEAMAPLIGQRIVVENVAGAASVAGTKQGIAAEPDGYTVVMGAASSIAINPASNPAADYN